MAPGVLDVSTSRPFATSSPVWWESLTLALKGSKLVGLPRINAVTVNWLLLIQEKEVSLHWFNYLLVSSGLAQYSGDPKTEWHLNAHATRDSLLDAVANLPYKGGNTLTGTLICLFNCLLVGALPLTSFCVTTMVRTKH